MCHGPIPDAWERLADDVPVKPGASVLVSFHRLKNEHNALFAEAGAVGVEIAGDVTLDDLETLTRIYDAVLVRYFANPPA